MTTYSRLLANRDFRRLWLAQAISTTGDWLIVGLVIDLAGKLSGGSSSAVGALMSVKIIPALVLGAVIGVLVDRYDRRRTMIVSDLMRAALVLLLVFARSLWQVYLLVFLSETFALLFVPAKNATLPNIVAADELAEANSLSYTTDQITMFLGLNFGVVFLVAFDSLAGNLRLSEIPLLGPYVGKFLGAQAGLTLDALSFLASALLIWGLTAKRSETHYEPLTLSLVGTDVREGFRFLRVNAALLPTMLGVAVATLGIGTVYTAGYAYTSDVLGYGRGGAGFTAMIGVFALGMLGGAFLSAPVGKRIGHRHALTRGLAVFGVGLLAFAMTSSRVLAAVFVVFAGAGMAVLYVNGWTYLQESAEDKVRGRVFVTFETLIRVSLLVSLTASGAAADLLRGLMARAHLDTVFFNAPRVTLLVGALVVIAASVAMGLTTRTGLPPAICEEDPTAPGCEEAREAQSATHGSAGARP